MTATNLTLGATKRIAINPGDLKPRAIAALCAMRRMSRSRTSLREAIGDQSAQSTLDLLGDLRSMGLVDNVGNGIWQLTTDGVAWCETNGMHVCPLIYPSAVGS